MVFCLTVVGNPDFRMLECFRFEPWEQNLTFALKLQQTAETMYPGLMRPILFSARKYNMDVTPCSVLLEFGSDSNTIAEAEYSGHLMGKAIVEFINSNV